MTQQLTLQPSTEPANGSPRVAIVHDYLTQRGGAERVVLLMLRAFPGAPVYTSLYEPQATYPDLAAADIRTTGLNGISLLRHHHRWALPVLAAAFSSLSVDGDVAIISSSGWAHGIHAQGRKIVYCYAPARWLYQPDRYLGERRVAAKAAVGILRQPLMRWDRSSAQTAHRYLTTTSAMRDMIRSIYGLDAELLPPPPSLHADGPQREVARLEPGFFLCVSRLLAYKNVDAVVEAFASLPDDRLVVVGRGPEEGRLRARACSRVIFTGSVPDDQLRWLYAHSSGLIAAGYEDYGLTPLEAAAFGKPTLALRAGGYLDTVIDEVTGVFFRDPVPSHVYQAVRRSRRIRWDDDLIRRHAACYSEASFVAGLRRVVAEEAGHHG